MSRAGEPGRALAPGQSATVVVPARRSWVETGLDLEAGAVYHMEAAGTWSDGAVRCTADGFPAHGLAHHLAAGLRRAPDAPWLALIGAIERDRATAFLIGRRAVVRPSRSGRLACFANDTAIGYWNNAGSVALRVSRTI